MRIIGPNASFAGTMARPGSVAFVSQSGALFTAILDWSLQEMVGFSAFVSIGSMLDANWEDLIGYLGDDPRTESIVLYADPRRYSPRQYRHAGGLSKTRLPASPPDRRPARHGRDRPLKPQPKPPDAISLLIQTGALKSPPKVHPWKRFHLSGDPEMNTPVGGLSTHLRM